jgi:hypothetical protein
MGQVTDGQIPIEKPTSALIADAGDCRIYDRL